MRQLTQYAVPSLAFAGEELRIRVVEFSEFNPKDKLRALRGYIEQGCDPQMQELAAAICGQAGVAPKDSIGEARAILRFAQAIPYRKKKPETFRDAWYTIQHGYGDCPQKSIVFCTLCESIGIPTELVALGERLGLFTFDWFHVYPTVLLPAPDGIAQIPAETTLSVPLGFDPLPYAQKTMGSGAQL